MGEWDDSLDDALKGVDPSAPSVSQLRELQTWTSALLSVPADEVYGISISKSGNLVKQAEQSKRALKARVLIVVVRSPELTEGTLSAMPALLGYGRLEAGLVVLLTQTERRLLAGVQPLGSHRLAPVANKFPAADVREVAPEYAGPAHSTYLPSATQGTASVPTPADPYQPPGASGIEVDPRVRRMIRAAVASHNAVMLVGPPGTGKTTLVDDTVAEVFGNPAAYGFAAPPSRVDTVTPDEGWDARTLVGGETIDDKGRLRFRPGKVLEAIRRDAWLILDEANRADLDRIFGGVLTWLAGGTVTLGRASNNLDAADVVLTWDLDSAKSYCDGYERLESGTGPPIRFVANGSWRLLGTYNALDAQRVFRFGQALGRRFQRVPVSPVEVDLFAAALVPELDKLPSGFDAEAVGKTITGLYRAHRGSDTPLGPAVFLAMPRYLIAAAAGLHPLDVLSSSPDLVAEAYVLAAGSSLAHFDDDELADFGQELLDASVLTPPQWTWVSRTTAALS